MGIAIVVPAQRIVEFFDQDEIRHTEEKHRLEWHKRNAPVPDDTQSTG